MRQHPLLRWIEQAEERRAHDSALWERVMAVRPERTPPVRPVLRARPPRRLWPWWPRTRTLRAANDLC